MNYRVRKLLAVLDVSINHLHFLVGIPMSRAVSSLTLAIASILAASNAAHAQDAAADASVADLQGSVEEIIVTAQRREESIQDVPLSVQAFTGAALEQAGVDGALDLPRLVPNLNIARGTQTANVRVAIRGVGAYPRV